MSGLQLTDKLVEKIGVQRTPAANPEMYKTDDYSVHLKGSNKSEAEAAHDKAGTVEWLLACLSCSQILKLSFTCHDLFSSQSPVAAAEFKGPTK